ncbi:DUF4384 domain-containing protein [Limnobacter alexandrii]|uniref:DUF4384 domain-containing protein n=1 Tax=Limnobacter alexandrii TaxID=2570352 RepID=UPI001107E56D|nr:DUF4384 domain-containing protein [Limnobacter alexandrii]
MNKVQQRWSGLGAMLLIAISGCAVNPRNDADFYESAYTYNKPVVAPIRSVSNFNEALACMDKLLADSGRGPTLVTSKAIPDASGRLFVGTKDMVVTALHAMSRTSNAFRFVDFELNQLSQDSVQGMTNWAMSKGYVQLQMPRIYVSGSISFMDQNIRSERQGAGLATPLFDFGASRDKNSSVFGMDLHLGDFTTRTLIQGIASANEIVVANAGMGTDAGGRINKTGVQFNLGAEVSQGVGPAVRSLVDLGMIELIGKWAQLPYWQCLALDSSHPEYMAQMLAWWEKMTTEQRVRFFQTSLSKQGYFAGQLDGKPSATLEKAILAYQADQNLIETGRINFETYAQFMRKLVVFDEAGNLTQIGWPATAKPAAPAKPTLTVRLNKDDRVYYPGENLTWTFNTSRRAYVYCYYQDSAGVISQVYPNMFQNLQPVAGNKAIVIPDQTLEKNFLITLNRPGVETLLCAASPNQLASRFPPALKAKPLLPMQHVDSMAEIQRAFSIFGPDEADVQVLRWTVLGNN